MSQGALFIRHKALPGKREEVRAIWEKYARSYVEATDGHISYFYGYDAGDPDAILVFQLQDSAETAAAFLTQPWFAAYETETAALLAGPSEFRNAEPRFVKGMAK